MTASQQCHARGNLRARYLAVLALFSAGAAAQAEDESRPAQRSDCDVAAVIAHVQEQYRIYGPRSDDYEYFGFIYRVEGELASVVVRSNECRGADKCTINLAPAAKRIPQGAKVMGEWHTHPHLNGSRMLSSEDVRGAHNNVHIRCYAAYYAAADGEIFAWDPRSTSVVTAMNSRILLGSYPLRGEQGTASYVATAGVSSKKP